MAYELKFNHGDEVLMYDKRNNFEGRGRIVGRAECSQGAVYDVQPRDEMSMASRICGVPEQLLRPAMKPMLVAVR